jgi:hypothetical protein
VKIREPWLTDLDFVCYRCRRTPDQINEYVWAAAEEGITPFEYVWREEGTLNQGNGHFCCTECYIEAGMPVSPQGWKAP